MMTLEDMAALHAQCFPDRPWHCDEIGALLKRKDVLSVVGEHGFILASYISPEAEILSVAVRIDKRRMGVAQAMFRTIWSKFQQHQIDSVFLEVAADNSAALKLYDSLNFQQVGRRKAYYRRSTGPGVDALVLRRELT